MVTKTEETQLNNLENQVDNGGGGAWEYLSLIRKLNLRRSDKVLNHGLSILNNPKFRSTLGPDEWTLYEQVAVAAMDCQCLDVAKDCIKVLRKRFPESKRVGRLEAMLLEAKGSWELAEKAYTSLLEDSPLDQTIHKRRVAMAKAQGNISGAIEWLNKYLEIFMADHDAWRELAEIYVSLQMYKQAAFCYEELILSQPTVPLYHLAYADYGTEHCNLAVLFRPTRLSGLGLYQLPVLNRFSHHSFLLIAAVHSRLSFIVVVVIHQLCLSVLSVVACAVHNLLLLIMLCSSPSFELFSIWQLLVYVVDLVELVSSRMRQCRAQTHIHTQTVEPELNFLVLYTLGGLENLQTAKKYYASTIDLTGGKNTRALFGVCLCTSAIVQLVKGKNKEDKEGSQVQSLAAKVLEKEYKQKAPDKLPQLTTALKSLTLSS
ncbi:hypothetical protein Lal_00004233 [Lupinus albus]|nr:hypothetical protein Lal_00004233 [Lupinus albus]